MSKLAIRVLIVEDDPDYNSIMHELLSEDFESVMAAFNGEQALKMVRSHTFDCVVSDIQMPIMDGLSMTRAIRSEGYAFPILLVTGQSHATAETARSVGANALMQKPVDFPELVDRICSNFDASQRS